MAMAKLRCTCATCGATFIITRRCYNSAAARSWEAYAEGYYDKCTDCYKAEKEAERKQEIKEREAEFDLPELTGTPRQIQWATDIRLKLVPEIAKYADKVLEKSPDSARDTDEVLARIMAQDSAHWWIEGCNLSAETIFNTAVREMKRERILARMAETSKPAYVIRPENPEKSGSVQIQMMPDHALFHYEKDDRFIAIMHRHDCRWASSVWCKNVSQFTTPVEDLVAEIGADLVLRGFTVEFPNEATYAMAKDGTYKKEVMCWVLMADDKHVKLYWPGKNNSLYNAAMALKGATWNGDTYCVHVHVKNFREIQDFAERHGFGISDKARAALDAERDKITKASVGVTAPKEDTPAPDVQTDFDHASYDILDKLRDEED